MVKLLNLYPALPSTFNPASITAMVSLVMLHQNKFFLFALKTKKPSVRLKNVASKIRFIGSTGAGND